MPTEHFKHRYELAGIATKTSAKEILVSNPTATKRTRASFLRRALIEVGVDYKCGGCGITDTYNGKPTALEVDHINGDWHDNQKENLRFMCRICHGQTPTFGSINRKPSVKIKVLFVCMQCGGTRKSKTESQLCRSCSNEARPNKVTWPSDEELIKMLDDSNFVQVGKKLGVSDNAIRKHLGLVKTSQNSKQ
jgi:hypothetical protein